MEKHITNAWKEAFLNKSAQWKQTLMTRKVSLAGTFHRCAVQNFPNAKVLLQ